MATKAAKSITINATKYELANGLAMNDDKIQLLAKDVVLGEVELPSGVDAIFFIENSIHEVIEVKNAKGETISDKADAYAIIEKGGMAYRVYDGGAGDVYEPMSYSHGTASGFVVVFERQNSGSITDRQTMISWNDSTPTNSATEYYGSFSVFRSDLTSLSDLVVGAFVYYNGYDYPLTSLDLATITLGLYVNGNGLVCKCISRTRNEYGEGFDGLTFLASYNSDKYLIGLKHQNNSEKLGWTIGSLKSL